jgi:hypothetical protein
MTSCPTADPYVSGWISTDGTTGGFDPFQTILSRNEPEAPLDIGTYQVVLEDTSGNVLSSYPFNVTLPDGEEVEQYRFSMIVSFDPAPAKITLRMGELILAEQSAGTSTPTVSLTAPAGGEDWSEVQTITWTGTGQAPIYRVEYSGDGGQTWIPLATGLTDPSLAVDFNAMPGSEQAQIRVIASDGFNYAVAQSTATFQVPTKSPQITVSTPAEGETFTGGLPIIARVTGFDWEDGALTDEAVSWSSDKDGDLGTGLWVMIPNLSVGEHVLTATATDSDGKQGSASVHITIIAPEVETITPYGSKPVSIWIMIAMIGVLVIALLVMLFILLRQRRQKKA